MGCTRSRSLYLVAAALLIIWAVPGAVRASGSASGEPADTDSWSSWESGPAGIPARTNDCLGDVVWDTGMSDDFTPPNGCPPAASAGCFIHALNEDGLPQDGRRLADDWIADTRAITSIKIWARYNEAGYAWHQQHPGSLHGFCVKFYRALGDLPWCPDGSLPEEAAIGDLVYDEYSSDFTEYEIPGYLPMNFDYCINLPSVFFPPQAGGVYWVSVSADFDCTTFDDGVTQWFCRMAPGAAGGYDPYCEASWWDTWNQPATNWNAASAALGVPCWAGWAVGFVLYQGDGSPVGACCDPATGNCLLCRQEQCLPPLLWKGGPSCDPNPCPQPVPVEPASWGRIKLRYRDSSPLSGGR